MPQTASRIAEAKLAALALAARFPERYRTDVALWALGQAGVSADRAGQLLGLAHSKQAIRVARKRGGLAVRRAAEQGRIAAEDFAPR